jgi:hypothetical protein
VQGRFDLHRAGSFVGFPGFCRNALHFRPTDWKWGSKMTRISEIGIKTNANIKRSNEFES